MTGQLQPVTSQKSSSSPGFRPEIIFYSSALGMLFYSIVSGIHYLWSGLWQYGSLGIASFGVSVFCFLVGIIKIKALTIKIFFVHLAVAGLLFLQVIYFANTFLVASPLLFIYSIFLSSSLFEQNKSNASINFGLGTAVIASLLDVFSPIPQIESTTMLGVGAIFLVILGAWMVYLGIKRRITLFLNTKLIIAGIGASLIPSFLIGFIQVQQLNQTVRDQTQQSLRYAATQTAQKIDEYLQTNKEYISRDATLPVFAEFLSTPPSERSGSQAEANLRRIVETLQKRPQAHLSSYGLLDIQGMNVYDTNPVEVGRFEASRSYFQAAINSDSAFISNIEFSTFNNDPFIFFASPVKSASQKTIGVLRARFDASAFQEIAQHNQGLIGLRSYPILVDENFTRIADTISPGSIYKSLTPYSPETYARLRDEKRLPDYAATALSSSLPDLVNGILIGREKPLVDFEFQSEDSGSNKILQTGYITYLNHKPWSLVYIQEQAYLAVLLRNQIKTITLFATLIAGTVSVLAILAASVLAKPINILTRTATRIAEGDLNVKVNVNNQDEVGTMGNAFNLMTERLKTLIQELEERVHSRTLELEQQNIILKSRNQQIQTLSEVARGITSTQNLENLLANVTSLLSDQFGFYHVGIFLLDKSCEFAELRAANSEGGKRMLDRQHKLKVGQLGIVGYVTGSGKPRIALDVGEDTVHFKNPDLPLTRSEMALPLLYNQKVIGALDVQSEKMNAFSDPDIELFATLADQIAIAIQNSRLYQETNQALEESQILHRQYLRQEWTSFGTDQLHLGYVQNENGLRPLGAANLQNLDQKEDEGSIVVEKTNEDGVNISVLKVPVIIRGEIIGFIRLKDVETDDKGWTEDDKETAQMIAEQVSQALENARLFEQTVRRAERERKVMEITNKIRSTNQPEKMLQIATEELQIALHASQVEVVFSGTHDATPDKGGTGKAGPKNNGHKDHQG